MPHPRKYHQGPDIQLFVLRVIIEQYFDDSDNGDCYVCDRFADIRYSVYRHELHNAAERLAWLLAVKPRSAKLTKEIREIWPCYDNEPSKDIKVEIVAIDTAMLSNSLWSGIESVIAIDKVFEIDSLRAKIKANPE